MSSKKLSIADKLLGGLKNRGWPPLRDRTMERIIPVKSSKTIERGENAENR